MIAILNQTFEAGTSGSGSNYTANATCVLPTGPLPASDTLYVVVCRTARESGGGTGGVSDSVTVTRNSRAFTNIYSNSVVLGGETYRTEGTVSIHRLTDPDEGSYAISVTHNIGAGVNGTLRVCGVYMYNEHQETYGGADGTAGFSCTYTRPSAPDLHGSVILAGCVAITDGQNGTQDIVDVDRSGGSPRFLLKNSSGSPGVGCLLCRDQAEGLYFYWSESASWVRVQLVLDSDGVILALQ